MRAEKGKKPGLIIRNLLENEEPEEMTLQLRSGELSGIKLLSFSTQISILWG